MSASGRVHLLEMRINDSTTPEDWDLPEPFIATIPVAAQDIDAYEHVNNAVYVTWLDRAAWEHSAALGLPIDKCLALDKGMAVVRSCIAYLRPALLGDTMLVGTWLMPGNSKLRVGRRFQVRRQSDGATLARADIQYACIELSSGRPARWPPEFRERYQPLEAVVRAAVNIEPV